MSTTGKHQGGRGHLIQRECPGLVAADDARAAQGFDAGQSFHDRVLPGHLRNPDREGDGRYGRKPFGDAGDRECDRCDEQVLDAVASDEADEEHEPDDDSGELRQAVGEPVELFLEWCLLELRRPEQTGNTADLGLHRDCGDDELASAPRHCRVHEDAVPAVADPDVCSVNRCGGFLGWLALAGQGGFFDLQLDCCKESSVGRHPVAGFDEHDVAGHEFFRRDGTHFTVTTDTRGGDEHPAERVERCFGPVLLDETDHGVEQHDDDDNGRSLQLARNGEADSGGRQQDGDKEVVELVEEPAPRRHPFDLEEPIGARLLSAFVGFRRRQAAET